MTKRDFQDGMNSIQVEYEKKEKLLGQLYEKQSWQTEELSGKQLFYRKKRSSKVSFWKIGTSVMAAILACAILIPGVAYADEILNYFLGHLGENKEVAANVNKEVFHDEDNHVSIDVDELLSDGYSTCLTVRYTALDEEGKKWLFDGELLKDVPPIYRKFGLALYRVLNVQPCEEKSNQRLYGGGGLGTQEIVGERTETSRVFSVEYDMSTKTNRCILSYPLMEKSGNEVALDMKNLLETYTYELTGECSNENYAPRYLRISKIRYVVYGENHGVYETFHEYSQHGSRMVADEEIKSASLYFKNSSSFDLIGNGGGISYMGETRPGIDETYGNMDLKVLSGEFYGPGEMVPLETQEELLPYTDVMDSYDKEGPKKRIDHRLTVDPEDVEKIEINGDVYTLSRVE